MKRQYTPLAACVLVFTSLFFVNPATADKVATPETLQGVETVNVDWVKANMDSAVLVDTRKKAVYVRGHIPGAINIPYKIKSAMSADADLSEDRFDLAKLPQDKSSKIIVYCHAEYCWNSYKAAQKISDAGYAKVYRFRDGYPAWESAGYPVE